MCVSQLQVLFRRHGLAVSDPLADDVQRVDLSKLCLLRAAQVLEQLRPGNQAGPSDDSGELCPEVRVAFTVLRNDKLGAGSHCSNASSRIDFNSGNMGMMRLSLSLRCSVFGLFTRIRLCSQFTSAHVNAKTSDGHQSLPNLAKLKMSFHAASGQASRTFSACQAG